MNTLIITGIYFTTMMPVAMSIVLCGTGVGTMVFAALGHFLLVKTNWRISFLIQAGLAGSMGIAAMAFKPLKPIQVRFSSGVSTPKSQSAKVSHSKTAQGKGTVFIKREIPTQGSVSSLRTLQSLVWDAYLEDTVVTELKRKPLCSSKCCKICKKAPKPPKNKVLVLSAVKSDKQGRRRSYRESVSLLRKK